MSPPFEPAGLDTVHGIAETLEIARRDLLAMPSGIQRNKALIQLARAAIALQRLAILDVEWRAAVDLIEGGLRS